MGSPVWIRTRLQRIPERSCFLLRKRVPAGSPCTGKKDGFPAWKDGKGARFGCGFPMKRAFLFRREDLLFARAAGYKKDFGIRAFLLRKEAHGWDGRAPDPVGRAGRQRVPPDWKKSGEQEPAPTQTPGFLKRFPPIIRSVQRPGHRAGVGPV